MASSKRGVSLQICLYLAEGLPSLLLLLPYSREFTLCA